jgi:hypothetical protein
MTPPASLTFQVAPFSPPLKREFRGIRIASQPDPTFPSAPDSLRIAVSYLLDEGEVLALQGKIPAEALVLIVVSGYSTFAANITGDLPIFEDDYKRIDDLWLGYVNFRLAEFLKLESGREYYVTVSLGTWLSNTLHIKTAHA